MKFSVLALVARYIRIYRLQSAIPKAIFVANGYRSSYTIVQYANFAFYDFFFAQNRRAFQHSTTAYQGVGEKFSRFFFGLFRPLCIEIVFYLNGSSLAYLPPHPMPINIFFPVKNILQCTKRIRTAIGYLQNQLCQIADEIGRSRVHSIELHAAVRAKTNRSATINIEQATPI